MEGDKHYLQGCYGFVWVRIRTLSAQNICCALDCGQKLERHTSDAFGHLDEMQRGARRDFAFFKWRGREMEQSKFMGLFGSDSNSFAMTCMGFVDCGI